MTALQLNAEIYRAMGEIADNETLLAKVLVYVKGLVTTQQKGADASVRNGWAAAAKQAHADGEGSRGDSPLVRFKEQDHGTVL